MAENALSHDAGRPRHVSAGSSASQRLILQAVLERTGANDDLLCQALLWRGFLAIKSRPSGVWLAKGSHAGDLQVLTLIDGLVIKEEGSHSDYLARVTFRPGCPVRDTLRAIVSLPHNRGMTGRSAAPYLNADWTRYANMLWGAKVPVCPASRLDVRFVPDALEYLSCTGPNRA